MLGCKQSRDDMPPSLAGTRGADQKLMFWAVISEEFAAEASENGTGL